MKTLCIVPCGNWKIWDKNPKAGPTKAEYVYIGPFAKKRRVYAVRAKVLTQIPYFVRDFAYPRNII